MRTAVTKQRCQGPSRSKRCQGPSRRSMRRSQPVVSSRAPAICTSVSCSRASCVMRLASEIREFISNGIGPFGPPSTLYYTAPVWPVRSEWAGGMNCVSWSPQLSTISSRGAFQNGGCTDKLTATCDIGLGVSLMGWNRDWREGGKRGGGNVRKENCASRLKIAAPERWWG